MPAYSFKERFVPMVKDGSKSQTIRSFRKTPPKVGQLAHLYYGMRTKYCTKLVDPSPGITKVHCIAVLENGDVKIYDTNWLDASDIKIAEKGGKIEGVDSYTLPAPAKDSLAWRDGFRHDNDQGEREGCFDVMVRWWKQTHELPFVGNLIKW